MRDVCRDAETGRFDDGGRAARISGLAGGTPGRVGGHAASSARPARRGGAYGIRPHRYSAPVAATHLTASETLVRRRPDRALSRRELGVPPPRLARRRRAAWPGAARTDRPGGPGARARPRAARTGARTAAGGGAILFPQARQALGRV